MPEKYLTNGVIIGIRKFPWAISPLNSPTEFSPLNFPVRVRVGAVIRFRVRIRVRVRARGRIKDRVRVRVNPNKRISTGKFSEGNFLGELLRRNFPRTILSIQNAMTV